MSMKQKLPVAVLAFFAGAISLLVALSAGGQTGTPEPSRIFDRIDVMIPMRDGVRLHTEIYVPRHAAQPLPTVRTNGSRTTSGRPATT